jgi:thiol-disulfide isomerase/thioredoxin
MRLSLRSATLSAAITLSYIGLITTVDASDFVAKGEMAGLVVSKKHAPEPATQFWDAQGNRVSLADLKVQGKILVVDLWATWCGGCVREMPTFAKLQSAYRGRVVIAPISMDLPKDREKARAFMAQFPQLPFYQNTTERWPSAITTSLDPKVGSFPTALIFDSNGKEIARLTGTTADWDGRDAHALFDHLLKSVPHPG